MTYTIQLDFQMDDDRILTDDQISYIMHEIFNDCNCTASNVRVLEIND